METTISNHVLIVGTGLIGLAAAEAFRRRGIAVTILDAHDRVVEPWRRRHPALRLNIHRHFARLPGMYPPRADGTYLRRDSVVGYLERYARQIGVPIRFGITVEAIKRDTCAWLVRTSAGTFGAGHVIYAMGRDSVPHVLDWPGLRDFEGEVLHAADLGNVNRFDGKRVLVVGAGNFGSDVLNHLARHQPADVMISVRYGPAIVPNRVFGFPLHRAARLVQAMPLTLVDHAFALIQRQFFGDLSRHGMTTHPLGGGSRLTKDGKAFAFDDGFVAAIKSGRFKVAPAVSEFDRSQVIFGDGRSFEPDIVICATGYRSSLEPLVGHLGVLDARGSPLRPAGEPDPKHPTLWFTGYKPQFTGYFEAARIAAMRIGNGIASDLQRPAQSSPSFDQRNVVPEAAES